MTEKHLKRDEQVIYWEAPEFVEHEKSIHWYIGFIIISLLLVSFAVFSQSLNTIITFAILILISFVFAQQKAKIVECAISSTGITLGKTFYPYKIIRNFWIIYRPSQIKTLNFETTAYVNNVVSIQLGNQDPVIIKTVLKKYLIEDLNRDESLSDVIARRVKF
jgi:hypothetical protein